jgi:hypothetical protein
MRGPSLSTDTLTALDEAWAAKTADGEYVANPREINRAYLQLRQSLAEGAPFGAASFDEGSRDYSPRPHAFIEMIREHVYARPGVKPYGLTIAYGDGSEGKPFPLFSLPVQKRPSGNLFRYFVGLVSLRHMSADRFTERALIRNREIQRQETAAQQEGVAFTRTYACLEELLLFLKRKPRGVPPEPGLQLLLMNHPELQQQVWTGLEVHLFHTTGLLPATIGTYRGVLELLSRYKGKLIVVPRILRGKGVANRLKSTGTDQSVAVDRSDSIADSWEQVEPAEDEYRATKAWF